MLKRYANSSDERDLKIQSFIVFKEVSSGVYHVEKDRHGNMREYVSESDVVMTLNTVKQVAIIGSRGVYSNFDIYEVGE